ncbi:hypothetical protein SEA_MISSDAISY_49 [Mycobacterium phage MissDaisy]|nr:hypothetical protein SEA_MISSDAISY_49 [Mycobacterium phage MissDaisy]
MPPQSIRPTLGQQVLELAGPRLDDAIDYDPDAVVVFTAAGIKTFWQGAHVAELAVRRAAIPFALLAKAVKK